MPGVTTRARPWSSPDDVSQRLRRRWDDGSLLRDYARGLPWQPWSMPLRGPRPTEVTERLDQVREWIDQLEKRSQRGQRRLYRLEYRPVGGRVVGSNELPVRAWVDDYDTAWALLAVEEQVRRFRAAVHHAGDRAPKVREWMLDHPRRTLELAAEWPRLLPALAWLVERAGTPVYLRQIDVPDVDTKYLEAHRAVLTELLDRLLPAERVDQRHPRTELAQRYGFRNRPAYVRFRLLGGTSWPPGLTEMTARVDELAQHAPPVSTVFVVENEVTYLAFPPLDDAMVVLGGGYGLSRLGQLTWLGQMALHYWGDLDTHGFAILNQMRHVWPHTQSLLMDRATLLAHESQWVREPQPTNAVLDRLAPDEEALYRDLVEDIYGSAVRLEQERLRFSWLVEACSRAGRSRDRGLSGRRGGRGAPAG